MDFLLPQLVLSLAVALTSLFAFCSLHLYMISARHRPIPESRYWLIMIKCIVDCILFGLVVSQILIQDTSIEDVLRQIFDILLRFCMLSTVLLEVRNLLDLQYLVLITIIVVAPRQSA